MEEDEIIRLELTIEEVDLIFKSLGHRPFQEVFEIIGKINEQVNVQLEPTESQDDDYEGT